MRLKNNENHFGLIALIFHWIMAFLIIGLLAEGLYMVSLSVSLHKLKLYGWHKEYGLIVLGLVIVRLSWRLMNTVPQLSLPWLELLAARLVHYAFYAFMFAMPITGWLVTSAAGLPPSFFGLCTLPGLVAPNAELLHLFSWAHKGLGYGLIATIVLHSSAALKHHFINKDDILRRMIS
jgi:cytochrome b561